MKRDAHQALWRAHTRAGTMMGVLLFVLFSSGTVSVFRDDLRIWASPLTRQDVPSEPARCEDGQPTPLGSESAATWPVSGAALTQVLQRFSKHHPLHTLDRWSVLLPTDPDHNYELLYLREGHLHRSYLQASSGQYLGTGQRVPGELIFDLHANLSMRGKKGRWLVGLAGVLASALVISGLWLHRHKLRNAFTLRWGGSSRKAMADLHRLLGLWTAPFLLVICVSGAVLGLRSLLVNLPALARFRGDVQAAKRELWPKAPKRSGQSAVMKSQEQLWNAAYELLAPKIDPLLREAATGFGAPDPKSSISSESISQLRSMAQGDALPDPGIYSGGTSSVFVPTIVSARAWTDANARWSLAGWLPGHLAPKNEGFVVELRAVSAEPLRVETALEQGLWQRGFAAASPFHYGDLGGLGHAPGIKLVYALSGLAGSALIGAGLLVWARRRGSTSHRQAASSGGLTKTLPEIGGRVGPRAAP